jgi:hypothetical protein
LLRPISGSVIGPALAEIGFLPEPITTNMVAKWAYQQAVEARGHVWLGYKQKEQIGRDIMLAFP